MFADAYKTAAQYTKPIVMSYLTPDGTCGSGIGSYVVLNGDGWCLTAAHIIEQRQAMSKAKKDFDAVRGEIAKIEADQGLNAKKKRRAIAALTDGKQLLADHSDWWGIDNVRVVEGQGTSPELDLAVVRLAPFKKEWVKEYPTLKDPAKGISPGTSLCRLGFPLHSITPTYDEGRRAFVLPKESVPLPLFPIDGILTREVALAVGEGGPTLPFPMKLIETSTPGLKGQSGGPIFDTKGTVWGIQSRTIHYALGFEPPVPQRDGRGQKVHQFLNVGWAIHPETICGMLDDMGVQYSKSAY